MRLPIKNHQQAYTSNGNYISLVKAYIFRDITFPFVIYNDNIIVGYIQYKEMQQLGNYLLEKIMIADIYQGKGYASQSMLKLIEILKNENKFNKLRLCVHKENTDAIRLYKKFNFQICDEEEEESEIVLGIKW